MPFKGDRRLGGRRRNDSTLNGMTEGPDFPAAGAVLRQESNLQWPIASGGGSVSYDGSQYPSQYGTFNVKADGVGGEYVDYSVAIQSFFYSSGTYIMSVASSVPIYIAVLGNNYQSGTVDQALVHDGSGGSSVVNQNAIYVANSTEFLQVASPVNSTYGGQSYQVGNGTLYYYHDGSGGYTTAMNWINYYSAGVVVGSFTTANVTTIIADGNWYGVNNGVANYNVVTSDSNGGLDAVFTSTSFTPSGTILLTQGLYSYASDGNGGYTSHPAIHTPTGNNTSGTNYIEISSTSYENGTYSSTEYHNGTGGYYTTTTYSYKPNGESLGSYVSGQDEYGNDIYGTYYSDGNGGYYT
jgi:hypothetical protein